MVIKMTSILYETKYPRSKDNGEIVDPFMEGEQEFPVCDLLVSKVLERVNNIDPTSYYVRNNPVMTFP